MDSQLAPAHRHIHEEDPHSTTLPAVIEGEDEHHEKNSILKKVKAKAKKLKDTLGIKKQGHGHDHDHDPEVEEDDGEEEFEQAPSIYVHKTIATRIVLSPHENKLEQSGADLGPKPQLRPLEKDPQAPKDGFEESDPGNYQTKATDPTSTGGKEAGVTTLVSSFGKMGISIESGEHKPWSSTESHGQLPSNLPPIKTHITGENSQVIPESFNADEPDSHSRTSKVEEQPNQSSYTEKISAATSTIAEKAASAKNVVTSKLGYGGNDDAAEGGDPSKSATVGEYGRKVASTVTEELAPVYEKVAEAGSAVVSKMQGTGTGMGTGTGTGMATENRDVGGTDKGVSVKEYVAENLRPSDEDKALSEVISEALHTHKGEEPQKVSQPQGKVTESAEVARRLGSVDDGKTPEGMTSSNEVGKGMVDSFKGAVTSWFGKNGERQPPPQHNTSLALHGFSHGGGDGDEVVERKLNEFSN